MKQATDLLHCTVKLLLMLFFGFAVLATSTLCVAQEPTPREVKNVQQVKTLITKAGELFKNKKFKSSARLIANVQKKLDRFGKDAAGEYRELLQSQHDRMAKAHAMLLEQGQKLADVEPLPSSNPASDKSDSPAVSFVDSVAPIINAKCGRCHVANSRGQFSAKDYTTLMDSTTVTEGEPDVSRLIEVIEDGSMPKGGLKVTAAELVVLKSWIGQGAKFDGDDPLKGLAEFGSATNGDAPNTGRRNRQALTTEKPTGNETVSFGEHVAPVLLQHCGRCHMARNPRGNFNMTQFRNFMRGGDSGSPVEAGNSANSNLLKRLRGIDGDIMPPRGKLDDKIINDIAKWIDEGARFDPADAALTMQAIAAKGKSQALSHESLIEFRKGEAERIWKLAMSDVQPQREVSENFYMMGTPTETGLAGIAAQAESLAGQISKQLGTQNKEHFIRGGGTLFVVTRRYDFGEFGTMLLRREFPRSLRAYWNHNQTIAYSVLLQSRNQSADERKVVLTRQLASLHIADLSPSIPRWFSDGMGFRVAADMHRKDPLVLAWESQAAAAANAMQRIDDFLNNRMDEDKSGLVSFLFVGQLKSDKRRFKKLMDGLKSGQDFDVVFAEAWGKTAQELFSNYKKW